MRAALLSLIMEAPVPLTEPALKGNLRVYPQSPNLNRPTPRSVTGAWHVTRGPCGPRTCGSSAFWETSSRGQLQARPRSGRVTMAATSREARLTCVMPTLQTAVVVADGVQVVQEVQRVAGRQAGRLLPGGPGARPRRGAGASLRHVRSHVEAG